MKPKSKKRKTRGAFRREAASAVRKADPPADFPIAGVGASAGGLEALERFLKALPANTGTAFVLVQHLDPMHESRLTEILSHSTPMTVAEATEGMQVEPNRVYVIPPNKSMSIRDRVLHLEPRRNSQTQHMPIDFFFRSLADDRKHKAIGIILSGTASDGATGMRAIKAEGGITFAQDPGSARYSGMPQSSIASGAVDFVLSPAEIAEHLSRIGNHPYLRAPEHESPEYITPDGGTVNQLIEMLRKSFGVDFRNYKGTTVNRRIRRRMALNGIGDLEPYLDYVKANPREMRSLFQDMFVGVTEFFRDPGLFKILQRNIFPAIMKTRSEDAPIRIWVPGCSTGEEVYSIVIALLEFLGDRASSTPTQIFGTDANEEAIRVARLGKYGKDIALNVGQDRLRRYFVKEKDPDGYAVSKAVRDRCVFATHDITRDAPFRNLDLLSCRNLLIYLNTAAHQRLIPLFHFTLKSTGYLVLGSAETIGGFGELFNLVERHYKIYSKKFNVSRPYFELPREHVSESAPSQPTAPARASVRSGVDLHRAAADQILLSHHGPPAVLVNEDLEILHFRGHTGPYLEQAQGAASLNLLRMAREGLLVGLEKAIGAARKKNGPARQNNLHVAYHGKERIVDISVLPIRAPGTNERTFLIVFEDHATETKPAGKAWEEREKTVAHRFADERISQLQQELAGTRAYLQSVIENQQATNEELRSLNEEIQSSNEELQSTTEELETANEELQSANEELNTLNEELQHRSAELGETNTRLQEELTAREQAEEQFRTMVESAPDAMVLTTPEGNITLVNRQAESLFGYTQEQLIGHPVEMLMPERFRKQHVSHRTGYMKEPKARPMGVDLDLWGLRKDGSEFPIEVSLSPLAERDGSSPVISSIIRDVSRRRALSERLQQTALLEERNRMARDVHDTLAQDLTGIVLLLETAEEELKKGSPESLRRIARARELARSTLGEARQSTLLLSASSQEGRNLSDSIRQLLERFRSETPITLEFSHSGTPRQVNGIAEDNLTRIAQQAITNALQHSQASRIRVELKFNKNELKLRVTDNGKGFDASSVKDGFGLKSMGERAKELGGKFNLATKPGKGTQIEVQVPVSQPAGKLA